MAMRTVYALIPDYASPELLQDASLLRLLSDVLTNAKEELKRRGIVLWAVEPARDLEKVGVSDGLLLMQLYCSLSDCVVSLRPTQSRYPTASIDFMVSTARARGLPIIDASKALDGTDGVISLADAIAAVENSKATTVIRTQTTPAFLSRAVMIDPSLESLLNRPATTDASSSSGDGTPRGGPQRIDLSKVVGSFACEVNSLNCARVTPEAIRDIRHYLDQYKLLIFRKQKLTCDDQIRFTAMFGRPDVAWDNRNRSDLDSRIQIISNQYKGGEYHYDRSRRMSTVRYWHADTSFLANPTRYTFLFIQKVPAKYGASEFINTKMAYAELPVSLKKAARDKLMCHSFNYIFGKLLKVRQDERSDIVPDVTHPLVWRLRDGDSLYLSELTQSHIIGLSKYESDKLITQLMEHCKLPEFRHTHIWREGDFLVWDNIGIMHRGGFADPEYERILHRTTVTVQDATNE